LERPAWKRKIDRGENVVVVGNVDRRRDARDVRRRIRLISQERLISLDLQDAIDVAHRE
jgi:hypothetical protein